MASIVQLFRPILIAFLNSSHTKKLVCDLLDRYVQTTDNDLDDVLATAVRHALLK